MKIVDKDGLLNELREKFEESRKELGFKANFEDINSTFYIEDYILNSGFVSERFSRQLCARIVDTYVQWLNYFQGLLFPNSGSIVSLSESKLMNEADKKDVGKMLSEIMSLVTTNSVAGIKKDKKIEAKFIDEAVDYWHKSFKARATNIIQKINDGWKK